jgi:hypothetical protein
MELVGAKYQCFELWVQRTVSLGQSLPRQLTVLRNPKCHYYIKTARHWPLSWAGWIQSTTSDIISLRSSLILLSYLRLILPMVPLHVFHLKSWWPMNPYSSLTCSTLSTPLNNPDLVTLTIVDFINSRPILLHFAIKKSKNSVEFIVTHLDYDRIYFRRHWRAEWTVLTAKVYRPFRL